MKITLMLNGIVVLTLTGCAVTTPELDSSLSDTASVTCTSDVDCAQKWQRADDWIRQYSNWPIKRSGDAVLETERPRSRWHSRRRHHISRWYSRMHYRIVKEIISDTKTEIRMEASCQPSAYCTPNTDRARAAFVRFLQTGEDGGKLE